MPDSSGQPVVPRRPAPRSLGRTVVEWVRWFGPGRLLLAAVSTAVVAGVGVWVVRTPAPPGPTSSPTVNSTVNRTGSPTDGVPVVTLVGSPGTTVPVPVLVHVAGAVAAPGVHELPAGARVIAALAAAGGAAPDADLDALNLAAPLADGQRLYVPEVGEVVPWADGDAVEPGPPTPPVDVNRATVTELVTLPGVGPAIAAAIVDDRERNGPFAGVDDLVRVRGIGPVKLEAIRPLVTS